MENTLYYGDNLKVLREYIASESVDLIYLDPPFNSNRDYNILFAEQDGSRAASQIKAFGDTWRWDQGAEETYYEVVERSGDVSQVLQAFRTFLGPSDMLAYLTMMAPRLVELRRVLKKSGTIYLHCDPTASHYLKILMDAVFKPERFLNEIAWCYNVGGKGKRHWARKHDIILFYSKSNDWFFDGLSVGVQRDTGTKSFGGKMGTDEDGRRYQDKLVRATGKYYRYYIDDPKIPEDWWTGINSIQSGAAERLGYPTQKPLALLERIITASSQKDGVVLDPFCGCGTTISAAHHLKRNWIGIDITYLAINAIKGRLRDTYGEDMDKSYRMIGKPESLPDTQALAGQDKYQFQWWALDMVQAAPMLEDRKKGADKGIDGTISFHDEYGAVTKKVIISVKGGQLKATDVRDLRGVIDRENAQIGVLLSLDEPTQKMRTEAATTGFYNSPDDGTRHPRLQLITTEQLLQGATIDMPRRRHGYSLLKKAPKGSTSSDAGQAPLSLVAEESEPYDFDAEPDS